jgi:thymidylate synthase (FAD)
MEIISPSFQILAMTGHPELPYQYQPSPELLIEAAGRTCYKSEDKITEGSAKKFVVMAQEKKHLTVLEHSWEVREFKNGMNTPLRYSGNWNKYLHISDYTEDGKKLIISGNSRAFEEASKIKGELKSQEYHLLDDNEIGSTADVMGESFLMAATVRFICDRGVSHEIVRHRPPGISQESTRYVNYFKKGMQFIQPCWWEDSSEHAKNIWKFQMEDSERRYNDLIKERWIPQRARAVLPNSLKTELVLTAPLSEWQHIFRQRALSLMGKAHEQMEEVMIPAWREFESLEPQFFSEEVLNNKKKMLWQIHHQFQDGHTEMVSQHEEMPYPEHERWFKKIRQKFPLPEGASWLFCNEKSEYFVWTTTEEEMERVKAKYK